jgi:hypothetical protein
MMALRDFTYWATRELGEEETRYETAIEIMTVMARLRKAEIRLKDSGTAKVIRHEARFTAVEVHGRLRAVSISIKRFVPELDSHLEDQDSRQEEIETVNSFGSGHPLQWVG